MAQQELIAPRREDALIRLLFGEAMPQDEPVTKYSEDQPRDDNGRWGDGEGGGDRGAGTSGGGGSGSSFPVIRAGGTSDGRSVLDHVPNMSSIESSLNEYDVLPGVRDVPFAAFTQMGELSYRSASEEIRTQDLAQQIQESKTISPLIIVIDNQGPYVLEGGHRFDALRELGAKSFPAVVVRDLESLAKPIGKAAPDPFWRRLHAIADKAEPTLRKAILQAIANTVAGVDVAALERALTSGNLNAAMKAIPWADTGEPALRAAYRAILTDTYDRAGQATAEVTGTQFGTRISFDLENPRATAWAANVAATRVVDVSEGTVGAIRSIVSRGFKEGIAPREMARLIRGPKDVTTGQYRSSVIGLTEQQANAVYNYRTTLQNDTIERSTEQEDRMVERYRDKLVLHRAETIARTETITASNEGQQESWQQAKEKGFLRGTEQREWIVTEDDRLCPYCEAMEGQRVGLDEPFQSDDEGEVMNPPLHPNCRCAMGLTEASSSD